MAITSTVAAVAGTAIGGYSAVKSNQNSQRARRQTERANRYQRQINDMQAARQRTEAIRAARMAYAESSISAEAAGVTDSSVAAGALGGIVSQTNSNIGFLNETKQLNDMSSEALGAAARHQGAASMWSTIGGLAMSAGNYASNSASIFAPQAALRQTNINNLQASGDISKLIQQNPGIF